MSRPLNDDEVQHEMRKMVAFIRQEASEKSRELHLKADEEFNIEKAKIVRAETMQIDQAFERKLRSIETRTRVAQSSKINKTRVQVLVVRDQLMGSLLEEAKMRLKRVTEDREEYKRIIKGLILQAANKINEQKLAVSHKKCDEELVRQAINELDAEKNSFLFVQSQQYLDDSFSGGVLVSGFEGRIVCDNTLETRLELLFRKSLPSLRVRLFGPSLCRKFFE